MGGNQDQALRGTVETSIDPQAAEWLRKALAKLREKLIDLSKRNPLVFVQA